MSCCITFIYSPVTETEAVCTSSEGSIGQTEVLKMSFDGSNKTSVVYTFSDNPVITEVSPTTSIYSWVHLQIIVVKLHAKLIHLYISVAISQYWPLSSICILKKCNFMSKLKLKSHWKFLKFKMLNNLTISHQISFATCILLSLILWCNCHYPVVVGRWLSEGLI